MIIDTVYWVNTPSPWVMHLLTVFIHSLYKNSCKQKSTCGLYICIFKKKVQTWNTRGTNLTSKTPTTSWWHLKLNSASIPMPSIYLVSDDNLPFVPILVSLTLFSFIAKSVKLKGIPIFLIFAIVVDRPRWMSHDPFKVEFIQICCIFYRAGKNLIFFYFLCLCYAID